MNESLHKQWHRIAAKLTIKQFEKTMGIADYKTKAQAAMKASKSQRVARWCENLIAEYDRIHSRPILTVIQGSGYFAGKSNADLKLVWDATAC